MPNTQIQNFISILRAACGNGKRPLHEPDWDMLVRLARVHALTAFFYTGAILYSEFDHWPKSKQKKLKDETIAAVVAQAKRTELFLELYQKFTDARLKPLVLKGILCRDLYGELADYRPSSDEDLYILPEEIEVYCQVLKNNGWNLISHEASMEIKAQLQELVFEDKDHLLRIELHPQLFDDEQNKSQHCNLYYTNARERMVTILVEQINLYTLNYTDHYLYLFLHFTKHFVNTGVGVRQVIDMMMFARKYKNNIDWIKVRRFVEQFSSSGLYADIAVIGSRLGFAVEAMFRPSCPEKLLEDIMEGGIYGQEREGQGRGTIVTIAAQYPTRWERIRRLIFPSVRQLLPGRPWLQKRPWLLPVVWVRRAERLFVDDRQWGRVSGKSLAVAYHRIALLNAYGLLRKRCKDSGKRPSEHIRI